MSNERIATRDIAEIDHPAEAEAARRADVKAQPPRPSAPPEKHVPLFHDEEGHGFRGRWEAIQTGFVDEPRTAVEQADALVAEMMKRLAEVFAAERTTMEQQWSRGDNVSTEDLRLALKRYRSFFERLLAV
jgi:hypothetical protein